MIAVWIIAKRRDYPLQPWGGLRNVAVQTWRAVPILVLPLVILGGIRFGAFTPTEAAVVAAAYAFVLGAFFLRTFRWSELMPILTRVGADTANLIFILAASSLYAWLLAREGIPQKLTAVFLEISREPWIILFLINVLVLLLGTVLEPVVCIVLLVPIFDPLIKAMGIDPVHFGIILTINLMIGLLTPPMGSVIFIMMGIAKISMAQFMRECWIFIVALTILLFIITYVPWLTLVLPNVLMPAGPG
jgi:tripartite ATP-independent transporter DctM subunit